MDFSFSKSHKLLQKSAKDFLGKECKDVARESEETDEGYSLKIWKKMAELGWMGIGIPDEFGGLGGNFCELITVLEEIGRVILPGPFISTVVCSSFSIYQYGSEVQKKEFLPKITDGELIVAPALLEPLTYAGKAAVSDQIQDQEDCFVLSGTRLFVPYAHVADWLIFSAKNNKGQDPLFLVDKNSPGVECNVLSSIGPNTKLCEVVLNQVKVPKNNVLGTAGQGPAVLKNIQMYGAIAHAAYILGMLERITEMTADYAKERVQFERPIGSFQAIQHQLAEMALAVEQIRQLTYYAGWKIDQNLPAEKEISMAKARAGDAARMVSLLGVKIHGGIGLIDEYDLQLYFRMAKAQELAFGDANYHRNIIAREIGLTT